MTCASVYSYCSTDGHRPPSWWRIDAHESEYDRVCGFFGGIDCGRAS